MYIILLLIHPLYFTSRIYGVEYYRSPRYSVLTIILNTHGKPSIWSYGRICLPYLNTYYHTHIELSKKPLLVAVVAVVTGSDDDGATGMGVDDVEFSIHRRTRYRGTLYTSASGNDLVNWVD